MGSRTESGEEGCGEERDCALIAREEVKGG